MTKPTQQQNRFCYQRVDSNYCGRVIVELGDDLLDEHSMEFFDQEYGEVCWYRFEPEDFEREEVKRLVSQQRTRSTGDYMQIDVAELRKRSQTPAATPMISTAAVVSSVHDPALGCVAA